MTTEAVESAVSQEKGRSLRTLKGVYKWILVLFSVTSIALCLITVFGIRFGDLVLPDFAYLAALSALFMPLVFLLFPINKNAPRDRVPWYDLVFAVTIFVASAFLFRFTETSRSEGWAIAPPASAMILGILFWGLTIEAIRRCTGLPFMLVVLLFSLYPLFAGSMPGIFFAKSYSLARVVGFHFVGSESMFGVAMQVFGQLLLPFMIFAVAVPATGAGTFFLNFANAVVGHLRGGGAKVSIVSSAMFATISGGPVSNVVTTGSITIPTMKRLGYPPYYAAAVEATASTGGVLTPPVMGAVAFIMAQFLGVPYSTVALAAAIPALLYYVSIYAQSDFFAAKIGLRGLPRAELPSIKATLKQGWIYFFALIILVYFMVFIGWQAVAPIYATGILLVLAMLRKSTRLNWKSLISALENFGRVLSELSAMILGVGLIIGSLGITGVAHGLASDVSRIAGGNVYLLLFLGAIASLVMGMGMTVTPCYIFLALLLAPAVIKGGFNPIGTHLFLLYFGMISNITPPVALASIAAASIAGANQWKTGLQALKLGGVALILPFAFVTNPALLGIGTPWQIIYSIILTCVGVFMISAGFEGYMLRFGVIDKGSRVIALFSGVLFFFQGWTTIVAAVLLGLFLLVNIMRKTKATAARAG